MWAMRILFTLSLMLLSISGCVSRQTVFEKAIRIEQNHNVIIDISNSAYISETNSMLDQIDKDLAGCPAYFKHNIGVIHISSRGFAPFVTGYVNPDELGWPIHLKSRSFFEKLLVWSDDKTVFLHEASHSFEMRMGKMHYEEWLKFYNEFADSKTKVNMGAMLARMVIPFADTIRPKGYATLYACTNHFEDFAETHCYLHEHNIEKLKEKDTVLYRKCKAVQQFTSGEFKAED